jgi:hypothetical protein
MGVSAHAQQPAEPKKIEQQVKAEQGKTTRIAVFFNAKADCSSGPLPTIRLAEPPTGGAVTIRQAKMKVTNYKSCLAAEFPAYVAFYKPKPDFTGTDAVTLEVKNDKGTVIQIRKINITVPAATQAL